MTTTLLMFIAAILLSTIAGYYSVIGMTAIFSGAFIPVLLMSGTLEASKVIVASWLYNNWRKTPFLLKSYLTAAVVVLMFITSMGIFGFLSKAHIQQAASGAQTSAQIERLQQEIDTQDKTIQMANNRLNDIMINGQGNDAWLNARIEQANKAIENAYTRVQTRIDDQQKMIDQENSKISARVDDIKTQITDIDNQVAALDDIVKGLVDQKRSVLAQKKRAEQSKERDALAKKKADLLKQIDAVRNAKNSIIDAAQAEISKIRQDVEKEITQARSVLDGLTSELGKNVDTSKTQAAIDEQNSKIRQATDRLNQLTDEKFQLETKNRQLEVEVGPIKYIAQLIYGDTVDMNMLERSVRYMIITLIFVFDPLAVLMLIASNQGLAEWKLKRAHKEPGNVIEVIEETSPILDPKQAGSIIAQPEDMVLSERPPDYTPGPLDPVEAKVDDDLNDVIIENDMVKTEEHNGVDVNVVAGSIDVNNIGPIDDIDELLTKLKKTHANKLQRLGFNISDSER